MIRELINLQMHTKAMPYIRARCNRVLQFNKLVMSLFVIPLRGNTTILVLPFLCYWNSLINASKVLYFQQTLSKIIIKSFSVQRERPEFWWFLGLHLWRFIGVPTAYVRTTEKSLIDGFPISVFFGKLL